MIGADGHVKLADFGLARQLHVHNERRRSFCGSSAYLSPEMITKKASGKACDVYGIGVVMFELLTGLPPYFDDDLKTMYKKIVEGQLKIPEYLSKDARNLLSVFLNLHNIEENAGEGP